MKLVVSVGDGSRPRLTYAHRMGRLDNLIASLQAWWDRRRRGKRNPERLEEIYRNRTFTAVPGPLVIETSDELAAVVAKELFGLDVSLPELDLSLRPPTAPIRIHPDNQSGLV